MNDLITQRLLCSECNKELNVSEANMQSFIIPTQLPLLPTTDKDAAIAEQLISIKCNCGNINRFSRRQDIKSEMIKPKSNKEYSEKMKQFLRDRGKI